MFSIGYFCESVNALRCSEMIRENVRVGIYSMIAKEIMPKCVKNEGEHFEAKLNCGFKN